MAYKCTECGNRSSKRFPGGKCPACDSFKVVSIGASGASSSPETVVKPKASKEKIALMLVFWALFLYGLWDNYLQNML